MRAARDIPVLHATSGRLSFPRQDVPCQRQDRLKQPVQTALTLQNRQSFLALDCAGIFDPAQNQLCGRALSGVVLCSSGSRHLASRRYAAFQPPQSWPPRAQLCPRRECGSAPFSAVWAGRFREQIRRTQCKNLASCTHWCHRFARRLKLPATRRAARIVESIHWPM